MKHDVTSTVEGLLAEAADQLRSLVAEEAELMKKRDEINQRLTQIAHSAMYVRGRSDSLRQLLSPPASDSAAANEDENEASPASPAPLKRGRRSSRTSQPPSN